MSRIETLAILSVATVLSIGFARGANQDLPAALSHLSDQLENRELSELRVYSSQAPGEETVRLYEIVPDERYVVQHPALMCQDEITAALSKSLATAIRASKFAVKRHRYAVDWVLQFYDENSAKRLSLLMGTGSGGFGKNSDPWHVEIGDVSYIANGPVRDWLISNYPHTGCTRFNIAA